VSGAVIDDFNNDGKPDLALAQFNQSFPDGVISGFVTGLLGNGDGTFQNSASTPSGDVGIGPLVSGDFIGNGNADLASANVPGPGGIAAFLGNGTGSFGAPIESLTNGTPPIYPIVMTWGDFNRDGKMDLVAISFGNNSSPLYMLLSQGDGTFTANLVYQLDYGSVPAVAVADFNHDGFLDLAATKSNTVLVFLGRGDGTFQEPVAYTESNVYPNSIAVGDFNGDGKTDMVVGHYSEAIIFFYAGNGDGTFKAPVNMPSSLNGSLAAADFNGDGFLDLIGSPGYKFISLGNGDGTFHGAIPFWPTYGPGPEVFGDLNGDGTPDLVQSSKIFLSVGPGPETATVWLSTPTLSFTASSLQFGAQDIGTSSSPKTILLSNAGNAPLLFTGIAASGDFSQTNTCANTLAIKDGCSIQVKFTPTANGPGSGSLTFTDNARPSTQRLALMGWAGPPDFVPSVSPVSVTVKAGSSAEYSLVLTSGDGFAGTVQVSCSGASSKASCTLSQQSVPLSANGTAKVQVTVSTTAPSFASLPSMRSPFNKPLLIPAFSVASVGLLGWVTLRSKRQVARLLPGIAFSLVFAACSGGGSAGVEPPPVGGTPPGNYTLTLTTVSGNSTHTTTLTLVVK
jgi:hypothetical protein